jgi:chorismate mutase
VSRRKLSTDEANRLERRLAVLSQQVREYPTPIARCDEQLAALLEERTRVLEALNKYAS